jgi:hypothetical protein
MKLFGSVVLASVALLAIIGIHAAPGEAQDWPEIFDPSQLLTLNLSMSSGDWVTIQNDLTFNIEVPAMFWADGEDQILVSVRRKSCDALGGSPDFLKVSLKIDINEFVTGQSWHGLVKLSLENGDDQDVVSEGLAWHLHRLASGPEGYGYTHPAAFASWVKLYINGYYTGVYVSAEQRDKRFLENRGLYTIGETWLYKIDDPDQAELELGIGNSPTYDSLCYQPFRPEASACPTPPPETLAVELPQLVNMQGLLTLAAVNTFNENPDALFTNGKNCFFADFLTGRTRMYFPWDLDAAILDGYGLIYPVSSPYATILLAVPEFRAQYSEIMWNLLCGPWAESKLTAFLDSTELLLTAALEADPNNQIPEGETVADHFDGLRSWASNRVSRAVSNLEDPPTGIPTAPGDVNLFCLYQPAPNPSRAGTRIAWAMPREGHVCLRVFDVTGRLVATLIDETRQAGEQGILWEGADRYGRRVPAGVYFARIEAGSWSSAGKIVRLQQ